MEKRYYFLFGLCGKIIYSLVQYFFESVPEFCWQISLWTHHQWKSNVYEERLERDCCSSMYKNLLILIYKKVCYLMVKLWNCHRYQNFYYWKAFAALRAIGIVVIIYMYESTSGWGKPYTMFCFTSHVRRTSFFRRVNLRGTHHYFIWNS